MIMDGEQPRMTGGEPDIIAVILRTREAEIIDTWYSLGMRGTDSNDVVVKNVFVPASRAYALVPDFEVGPHFKGPLYRFPGIGQAATIAVPVALGVARAAIDAFYDLAARKTPFGTMKTLRERVPVQSMLARAEAMLRSARLLYYHTIDSAWQKAQAGHSFTLIEKADLLLAGVHALKTASDVAEMMHRLAGTSGIYNGRPIERLFRDAQTLRHHGFVSESRYETVGQVYLGVPPEFAMVAF
jgi:alkylation response protein AidB-like acyl-CoA dehydrogenase